MITAKVTSKGQITIPKEVRDKLGVFPGEELCFEEKDGVYYFKKAFRSSPFNKWIGHLKSSKVKKTDSIIAELRGE